jgi:hypothetical protein
MPVKIVTDDAQNARTGVPQYYTRLLAAVSRWGLSAEWVSVAAAARGNPATDVLILTNQDAIRVDPEYAIIAVMHGSAQERFNRAGEPWFGAVAPAQVEAAKRPKTFWVSCSDVCAHECYQHMGIQAERIIFGGLDTDLFFPSERQRKRDTARPVVLHHCVDACKGAGAIHGLIALAGDEFDFRLLNAAPEEVPAAMRTADMFLCLSVSEGCPYVVSEALASGLVVVTTDVGLYWRDYGPPGCRIRWQDRSDVKLVANAVREAWKARHTLNGRNWALRWLNLPQFGKAWIEAVAEAAKRFGVNP